MPECVLVSFSYIIKDGDVIMAIITRFSSLWITKIHDVYVAVTL